MLVNFSNHPSALWDARQTSAAMEYGGVVDVPFPMVSADADEPMIACMAEDYVNKITRLYPNAVMCQGEYSLCFAVTSMLQREGITVLCAYSERTSDSAKRTDGAKESLFRFIRFRVYKREAA